MGHESFINKILKKDTPLAEPGFVPNEKAVREADEVIARASRFGEDVDGIPAPTPETMSPEDRLARSREILKELFAKSNQAEVATKPAETDGENYAKWTDPRYHNGREERPLN